MGCDDGELLAVTQDHRPSKNYRTNAVVLRTYKSGEADRIVVLMTEQHGKVRAVAKGARKSKRQAALLEPTVHLDAQLYRGKGDLDTVTQVQAVDTFGSMRSDLDRLTRAASFLEAVDHVTPDREPHERLYRMLVGALRTVADENPTLTAAGFFLKLLALEGLEPVLDRCISCGDTEPLVAFDMVNFGTRCERCRAGIPISDEGIRICRLILSGGLAAALRLPESPVLDDVNRLAATMVEHQTERQLKSLSVL
ncbi:MAG: DNA repair protein RecO [Actinomycetota bacterium]